MNIPHGNTAKLFALGGVIFFLFAVLVGQFFHIQILERDIWREHAGRQHYFDVVEPFVRGSFYSNLAIKKGHPEIAQKFAFDIKKFHLYIDPDSIPEQYTNEIMTQIKTLAHPSSHEQNLLQAQFDLESRSRKIVSWMDEETKERVMKWWRPFAKKHHMASNALFTVGDTERCHPFGKLAGQVLHTVRAQKDDISQKAYPTGGLELSQDPFLRGSLGRRRLLRSPRHSLETNSVIEAPCDGADVHLTINHCLQAIAEEELERGVRACRARCGWALMMDPFTGEILALAQYPFFYPDNYQSYFNKPDLIEDTKVKAITDANEPGSIMKPVSLAIALKANKIRAANGLPPLFSREEKIDTSHGSFPGRSKPISDTHFHHFLNMYLGIQKSSNIYAATLISRVVKTMGNEWYRNELENTFGFGKKCNIELPSESAGVLPTPGKKHPNGRLEWSVPTPYSLAFGHNIQATSIQMARVFAIFANGGFLVEPTLIRKIEKNGAVLVDNTTWERLERFPRVIDADIVQEVTKAMKFITKRGGTAPAANIWGYTEAGKTGTSEKIVNGTYSKNNHVSTFVGFTPLSHPAFVLLVCMDEPAKFYIPGKGPNEQGGICCAPVFREIGRRSLEYLGIPPDDPYGYPKQDPRFDPDKADWNREVEQLEALNKRWNG
jgi:cell division protein FtsI (penicillin-binding protein 3)